MSRAETSNGWKEPVFLVDLPSHGNPELARRLIAESVNRAAREAFQAFGEAIATVARAQLVSAACRGQTIFSDFETPSATWFLGRWILDLAPSSKGEAKEIESPHPADRAAEVVALLTQERGR